MLKLLSDIEAQVKENRTPEQVKRLGVLRRLSGNNPAGPVYLNFKDHWNSVGKETGQTVEAFNGPHAAQEAATDADELERYGDRYSMRYATTIVLHADGTWTEEHLVRL